MIRRLPFRPVKEAKADKAAQKRLKKEQGTVEGNDDEILDDLLDQYWKRDIEVNTTTLETLPGFPPPRGNASLTYVEDRMDIFTFWR
jgi:F0F1-type ATP synthase gamma subunit